MNNILMLILVTGLTMSAGAAGVQRVYLPKKSTNSTKLCANISCRKPTPQGKEYCQKCQNEIDRKYNEQMEKVKEMCKQVTVERYDGPEGVRIKALCGYELGSVSKLMGKYQVSEKGNVIVQAKLAKPFRKCTEVELVYSGKTLALCEIRLYSKELKGLSEEEVKAEVEGMKGVLAEKFKAEIKGWNMNSAVFTNPGANQYLMVSYESHDVKKVSLEKESNMGKVWTVSVTLSDGYFWKLELDESKPPVDTTSGLDAL